jgi:hypothetical protein
MAKQARVNGHWLASDLGFLGRWVEYSPEELAGGLRDARKGQGVKVVLDEVLPVLLQLRKLLQ